ncbi:hypothetical protein BsWGS_25939 [Bradybaena similaris]
MAEVRPYKVWNSDRSQKKSVTASSLKELIEKGCSKLCLTSTTQLRVVLEEDGTLVDEEEYFSLLDRNTTFLFLQNNECWRPGEIEPKAIDQTDASNVASVDEDLARLIASLRWDLANIMLFSPDQLQQLVDLETSQLATLLGQTEHYACRVQEGFQHYLDKVDRNNDLADLLKLYHRAKSSTGHASGGEAESALKSSPELYNKERVENLMKILQEIGIHQDWMPVFQDNPDLLDLLHSSIANVEENLGDNHLPMIPERSKLLLALSRCPPQDVKVVILGHHPISKPNLATGFAFSFPKGEFSDEKFKRDPHNQGKSLADLHHVLVKAGYLESGADYDGCHEVWAENGVLLLNAALTYSYRNKHFPLWQDFITRLLCLVAQYTPQMPVFFLCWGDAAKAISQKLLLELEKCGYPVQEIDDRDHSKEVDGSARLVVFTGHHPTWPRDDNQFTLQATNQFKAIKKCYSGLFVLPKLTKEESTQELADEFREKVKV